MESIQTAISRPTFSQIRGNFWASGGSPKWHNFRQLIGAKDCSDAGAIEGLSRRAGEDAQDGGYFAAIMV